MIKLALLGKDISHSLSPQLYREIYGPENVDYQLLDCASSARIPSLEHIFRKVEGLSITAPYKEHFLKSVILQESEVSQIAAINCIGKSSKGFVATNTDLSAMKRLLPQMCAKKLILILGDGVMARVVKMACLEKEFDFTQWSRRNTPELFHAMNLHQLTDKNILVINCCARSYTFNAAMPENATLWDLNYRHQAHLERFSDSKQYIDGLNLLKAQAHDAAAFWSSLKN